MVLTIGRMCVKTAGRDAGKRAVIVDVVDANFVMIDGETRRRKCNILHLEPLDQVIDIKKGASHDDVRDVFKELKITVRDTKPKAQRAKKEISAAKPRQEKTKETKTKETASKKKAKKEKEKI